MDPKYKNLLRKFIAVNCQINPDKYEAICGKISPMKDEELIAELDAWAANMKKQLENTIAKAQKALGEF